MKKRFYDWIALGAATIAVMVIGYWPYDDTKAQTQAQEANALIEMAQQRVVDLTQQVYEAQTRAQTAQEQAQEALLLSGLTPLSGPGIVLVVGNGVRPVQDGDIWRILNELCAGGAKAISIGQERMIAVSGVRQVGETLSINKRTYAAPFVIRAQGDMQGLVTALQLYGGVYDLLRDQIDIRIEASENVEIPAYVP